MSCTRRPPRSLCDPVNFVFAQEFRAAGAAITFLTRIPLPTELDSVDVARAGAYFPLVGAAVGALTGTVSRRTHPALGLAAQTVLTGALHLDALADAADALGTRDRERALEIMRDSRIGSFGTAALCLDLMLKAAALERCEHPCNTALTAGALSRAVPVVLAAALPYARSSGTAQALSTASRARAGAAVALALALGRDPGAVAIGASVALASAGFWRAKLGGVTGDTLGASLELTETAILLWHAR
jgi:adenosylcobinamide-GDP ribazoletransferase